MAPRKPKPCKTSAGSGGPEKKQRTRRNTVAFLACGNPGVGKSSTLSGLARKLLFKAGHSLTGSGVTEKLQEEEHEGVTYMDVPGLADVNLRKAAAAAIQEALSKPGDFHIIFVMTMEDGRVRDEDLTTMKLILDAINGVKTQVQADQYCFLMNKVNPKWLGMMRDKNLLTNWQTNMNGFVKMRGMPTSKHFYFNPLDPKLQEGDQDHLMELPEDMRQFLESSPTVDIQEMDEINSENFDQLRAKNEKLQNSNARKQAALERAKTAKKAAEKKQAKIEAEFLQRVEELEEEKEEAKREEHQKARQEGQTATEVYEAEKQEAIVEETYQENERCTFCGKETTAPEVLWMRMCPTCGGEAGNAIVKVLNPFSWFG